MNEFWQLIELEIIQSDSFISDVPASKCHLSPTRPAGRKNDTLEDSESAIARILNDFIMLIVLFKAPIEYNSNLEEEILLTDSER